MDTPGFAYYEHTYIKLNFISYNVHIFYLKNYNEK